MQRRNIKKNTGHEGDGNNHYLKAVVLVGVFSRGSGWWSIGDGSQTSSSDFVRAGTADGLPAINGGQCAVVTDH